jgi:hypothetical protein
MYNKELNMRTRTVERLYRIIMGGSHTGLRVSLALAGLAWTSASLATPAHFDIDAGDATQTLNQFSHQSNLKVLFDFPQLKNVHTNALHGDMEPNVALAALLKDTSLQFDFVNADTFAVTPAHKPKKPRSQ